MENYDVQMAKRVWQRVQGKSEEPVQPFSPLAAEEASLADTYRDLFKRTKNARLQELAAAAGENALCLKGICRMTGQPIPHASAVRDRTAEITLRRCYGRTLIQTARYESFAADPEYGAVFSAMAAVSRSQCVRLLRVLGGL